MDKTFKELNIQTMCGTMKNKIITIKAIQINGAWIVKDKNGVPKLVTEVQK
jgi:hypothetical protein